MDPSLHKLISFDKPTPIQSQAVPAILSGRNVLGVAKTGSGKTFAYLWPLFMHVMSQPVDHYPNALIVAPTRELAQQIFTEAIKYVAPIYGGVEKREQFKLLKKRCHVIIGTPGRIIDVYQLKGFEAKTITMVVLDEADQMLSMGFEPQVKSILSQVRPDCQMVMFSATCMSKLQAFASNTLRDALIIKVAATTNHSDIKQQVIMVPTTAGKYEWLLRFIPQHKNERILVFCNTREACDTLATGLNNHGVTSMSLHAESGDQEERQNILNVFRSGHVKVMIATDVASRGLDVKQLHFVVNYQIAKDVATHVHRVGRTGRAGDKGDAYTLVVRDEDIDSVRVLVDALQQSDQQVPDELRSRLGMRSSSKSFNKSVPSVVQQKKMPSNLFVRSSSSTLTQSDAKKFTILPARNSAKK
ncbi:DEAD-box ATP-dependent RNA helicase [Acrasis kona]|uniref:RNA helicase n=1 Tax=Acrasis kona TaxID=1008807 RepID=A0AAW2ZI76_9EUKA